MALDRLRQVQYTDPSAKALSLLGKMPAYAATAASEHQTQAFEGLRIPDAY
jgi:hypothetical protein